MGVAIAVSAGATTGSMVDAICKVQSHESP